MHYLTAIARNSEVVAAPSRRSGYHEAPNEAAMSIEEGGAEDNI